MIFSKKEPKEFKRWHLVVLVVIVASALFLRWYNSRMTNATLGIAGRDFIVMVAKTNTQKVKGLSDRDNLLDSDGMLFTFGGIKGFYAIVMRNMRFPLDVIWVDGIKIVDMAPNLPPDPSKDEAGLVEYRPRLEATEILEVPAGFIEKYGLKIGDTVVRKS